MADIACPECKAVGRVVLKSPSIAQAVTCPLCMGKGWTPTQPDPKWTPKPPGFDPDESLIGTVEGGQAKPSGTGERCG